MESSVIIAFLTAFKDKLRGSRFFRRSAVNATSSVVEYLVQPLSIVAAAPFLIRHLGSEQFGIWVFVSMILGSVGILSTGFGDATVKYVSAYRGQGDRSGVERTIRSTLTINCALSGICALAIGVAAPVFVRSLLKVDSTLSWPAAQALRISAAILIVRSVESVFVCAQKAYERYDLAVKLNCFLRIIVVISAVFMASRSQGIVAIMWATLFWSSAVVIMQIIATTHIIGKLNCLPTLHLKALNEVAAFGCYSWLQSLAAIAVNYVDRFLLAALLGASPLGIYMLCVQISQPIHSLLSAAFNFLFPHISSRDGAGDERGVRRVFRIAMILNTALAAGISLLVFTAAKLFLPFWLGTEFVTKGSFALAILIVSYAVLATAIVPHFGLLALGRVRIVAALNIGSGGLLIAVVCLLGPRLHLVGAAVGRLVYCVIVTIAYWIVSLRAFKSRESSQNALPFSLEAAS
jgi:O-antigen/teichoic acid export membrane protein